MCSPEPYLSSGAKKKYTVGNPGTLKVHNETPVILMETRFLPITLFGEEKNILKKQRNKCLVLARMSSSEQTWLFWLKQGFLPLLHQQR